MENSATLIGSDIPDVITYTTVINPGSPTIISEKNVFINGKEVDPKKDIEPVIIK